MSLSNISSKQDYLAINTFANNHIERQKQKAIKPQAKQKQNKKPSHLLTLPREMFGEIATFLFIKDKAHLALTCDTLYAKPDVSMDKSAYRYFNINIIKNAFEAEVNQFINLFKYNNGEFKNRIDITNEINIGTIKLPEDPLVLKKGFKPVFSNMTDFAIRDLLIQIKNNISPNKLEKLVSIAIDKMDVANIKVLRNEIIDKISPKRLEEISLKLKLMEFGYTRLHLEVQNGHLENVQALINAGAKLDAQDISESTPLYYAAGKGHLACVEAFINAGANLNAQNSSGWTPLYYAAYNGHSTTVEILAAGSNLEVKNEYDWKPLHFAARYGHASTVQALHNAGANLDDPNNEGMKPLHLAAKYGHASTVQALINAGANLNVKDRNGWTALQLATFSNRTTIVQMLRNAGATDPQQHCTIM